MNRRKFIKVSGGLLLAGGTTGYLVSDKTAYTRKNQQINTGSGSPLKEDEYKILYLASLAPSGHNTQPWLIKYIEPCHWIVCNDQTKWLPAVDPTQRETILSIGAFVQTLEYAANTMGYSCEFTLLAQTPQNAEVMDVKLKKQAGVSPFEKEKIELRRTVRSGYQNELLKPADVNFLLNENKSALYYLPNNSKQHLWLNEQTIEANRKQTWREDAQKELAGWIRFSGKDAKQHNDGLTAASMEAEGLAGWVLRNFYDDKNVMSKKFREQGLSKVKQQVSTSAGWIIITSKDSSVENLLETGRSMQRLFLKVRERGIAIHPMTQILEEQPFNKQVNAELGITDPVQFILRTGYVKNYPQPVSLRRPAEMFLKT
ncbi:MAG: nitroreductase family protein [Chitinophagaceae bacterium]|nr:nitroreductase family protein [Chitinophagaceae bacterium]